MSPIAKLLGGLNEIRKGRDIVSFYAFNSLLFAHLHPFHAPATLQIHSLLLYPWEGGPYGFHYPDSIGLWHQPMEWPIGAQKVAVERGWAISSLLLPCFSAGIEGVSESF